MLSPLLKMGDLDTRGGDGLLYTRRQMNADLEFSFDLDTIYRLSGPLLASLTVIYWESNKLIVG